MAKKKQKKSKSKPKHSLKKSIDSLTKEVRRLREDNTRLREQSVDYGNCYTGPGSICSCGEYKYPDAKQCVKCSNKNSFWQGTGR